jgi:hypothetical protein
MAVVHEEGLRSGWDFIVSMKMLPSLNENFTLTIVESGSGSRIRRKVVILRENWLE